MSLLIACSYACESAELVRYKAEVTITDKSPHTALVLYPQEAVDEFWYSHLSLS